MSDFTGRMKGDDSDKRSNSQKIAELLAKQRAKEKAEQQQARTTKDFKEYHQAWQNYYKKYYANVYGTQMEQQKSELEKKYKQGEDPLDKKAREMGALRAKIRKATRDGARRARRSRHFIPLTFGAVAVLVLLFIQYNSVMVGWIRAYAVPAAPAPGLVELDPALTGPIGDDTRLLIPKIGVNVPVTMGVDGFSHADQMEAMRHGVFHFSIPGANAYPGEFGNFAISGHSSNDAFTRGDYKFIFARLEQLEEGDKIFVHHEGVRYTYVVRSDKTVLPSDSQALLIGNNTRTLTLITCTPLGTSRYRLLVFAEQISPEPELLPPEGATGPPDGPVAGDEVGAAMPGQTPSLFVRLWDWLWGRS
ncbi:sortase [Candidatus Saccharibacteria bacterium]|nr:sortase [Candidatus Saccharibacteria bacterium]